MRKDVDPRRKFRSQTSDNMDRLKSSGGKSQRREVKRREDKTREEKRRDETRREEKRREEKRREEKRRRDKISEEKESEERRSRCAKRWESRETLCFPMTCGSVAVGRKVGLLKRQVRSHLAR